MYEQVAVAFNVTGILAVEVYEVCIERQRRIAEQKWASRGQAVREICRPRRCSFISQGSSCVEGANVHSRYFTGTN